MIQSLSGVGREYDLVMMHACMSQAGGAAGPQLADYSSKPHLPLYECKHGDVGSNTGAYICEREVFDHTTALTAVWSRARLHSIGGGRYRKNICLNMQLYSNTWSSSTEGFMSTILSFHIQFHTTQWA